MKRPERLARHYIRAAGLRAVYVATCCGKIRLGMTREPEARARDLKRGRAKQEAVFWCASASSAQRLIAAVMPSIEAGEHRRAGAVVAALRSAAREDMIALSDDATVQKRAAAVVADIDQRIKSMQASGHLRGLNADYREARADAARRGAPFMSYGEYLARYKIKLLYELARMTQ